MIYLIEKHLVLLAKICIIKLKDKISVITIISTRECCNHHKSKATNWIIFFLIWWCSLSNNRWLQKFCFLIFFFVNWVKIITMFVKNGTLASLYLSIKKSFATLRTEKNYSGDIFLKKRSDYAFDRHWPIKKKK